VMSLHDILTDLETTMTEINCRETSCMEPHTHTSIPHIVEHETMRIAVVDSLKTWEKNFNTLPYSHFLSIAKKYFLANYHHYTEICHTNIHRDGDIFHPEQKFQFGTIREELQVLKDRYSRQVLVVCNEPSNSFSSLATIRD